MWGDLFPLPDPASERTFRLYYGKPGMCLDLLASSMRLLVFFATVIKTLIKSTAESTWAGAVAALLSDSCAWGSFAMQVSILLVFAALSQEQYILFRGPFSVLHRLMYALGIVTSARPGDCKRCHVYWHHRMLIINTVCILCRTPAAAYWLGSAACWVTEMSVYLADPDHSCSKDLSCLAQALLHTASQPAVLLQKLQQPATAAVGAVLLLELVGPGVLLTYLEYRARKHWWNIRQQQQQHRQMWGPAAADNLLGDPAVNPAAATVQGHGGKQQEQQKHQQGCGSVKGVNASDKSVEKHDHCDEQQQGVKGGSDEADHHLAISSTAAKTVATAGAPLDTSGDSSTADQLVQTASTLDNDSIAAAKQLAAVVAAGMCQKRRSPRTAYSSTAHHSPAAAAGHTTPLTGIMDRGASQALLYGRASAAAGDVPSGGSALYISPVHHEVMSFKFNNPLDASPELFEEFRTELTSLVQQQHTASGDTRPLLTQFTAFPGCYQVVVAAVVPAAAATPPAAAAGASSQQQEQEVHTLNAPADADADSVTVVGQVAINQQQEQQQHLQRQIEQWLQGWPGWSLLAMQLHTSQHAASSAVADAAVLLEPLVIGYMPQGTATLPATSSNIMQQANFSDDALATVALSTAMQQLLQQQGYDAVRIVLVAQASGATMLDQSWQLEQMVPAGTPAGQDAAGQAAKVQFPVALAQLLSADKHSKAGAQQPQSVHVMSVVVLVQQQQQERSTGAADVSSGQGSSSVLGSVDGGGKQQHSASRVLLQQPLLLFPAAAAAELHQLYEAAVQAGMAEKQARLQLQDLIRDFAAVLCIARSPTATRQQQCNALVTALMGLFASSSSVKCLDVLRQVMHHVQQGGGAGVGHTAAAGAQGADPGVTPPVRPRPGDQAGPDSSGPAPAGPDNQPGHDDHGPSSHSPEASTSAAASSGTASSSHGGAGHETHSSDASSSSTKSTRAPVPECYEQAGSILSWVSRVSSCIKQQLTGNGDHHSIAQSAADAAQLMQHRDIAADALHLTWRTAVLGFNHQVPGSEQLYMNFKSSTLRGCDCCVTFLYAAVLAVLLFKSAVGYVQGVSSQQSVLGLMRVEFTLVNVVAHALVLLSQHRRALSSLQQWRSLILVVAMVVHVLVLQGCISHGRSHEIITDVLRSPQIPPSLALGYHHVIKPFTMRVGQVATGVYLLVMLWLGYVVNEAIGMSLGPQVSTVLMCMLHVLIAGRLEGRLRRRFVDNIMGQQQS